MVGRWPGDGRAMAGRWPGDGRAMVGQWSGEVRRQKSVPIYTPSKYGNSSLSIEEAQHTPMTK
eukprot:8409842-Lingulodinium_polyedra.AAC.1